MMPFSVEGLSASDIERGFSTELEARAFASFCNDIVWGEAGTASSIPSFTERINVPDEGIDGEWRVAASTQLQASSLLHSGRNIFQYKQRDAFSDRGRSYVITKVKDSVRGALAEIFYRVGSLPDRYVLFTNLHLTPAQNRAICTAIREERTGLCNPSSVSVSVVGAAELRAALIKLPYLYAAYFGGDRFAPWTEAWDRHLIEASRQSAVPLVGHSTAKDQLESALADPSVRGILVTGAEGVGKTRLILHTTRERATATVFVRDSDFRPSELHLLAASGQEVIVVIEDPTPDAAGKLLSAALSETKIKLVVALPTDRGTPLPNYGKDGRTKVVKVMPLTERESQYLIRAVDTDLDSGMYTWAAREAGGIPRILLLAAQYKGEYGQGSGEKHGLRSDAATFTDDIAQAIEARVEGRFGDTTLEALRLLSVLSVVGFNGEEASDLEAVCEIFASGDHATARKLVRRVSTLESAGFVRVRGDKAEVIPPFFADRLAGDLLCRRTQETLRLFMRLPPKGRLRLVERLCRLTTPEVAHVRAVFFNSGAPLADLTTALAHPGLFKRLAGAEPERTMQMVHRDLSRMSLEERAEITGERRLDLNYALEEMLFSESTCGDALWCYALLAEAENDTVHSNNATGRFCEVFVANHPQMPLPLRDRAELLLKLMSEPKSVDLQVLGLKAIRNAMRGERAFKIRDGSGSRPAPTHAPITVADLFDYAETLMALAEAALVSGEPLVRQVASETVSEGLFGYFEQARPVEALARLARFVDAAFDGRAAFPVARLADAIAAAQEQWSGDLAEADTSLRKERYEGPLTDARTLIVRLEEGPFPVRLKLWCSDRTRSGLAVVGSRVVDRMPIYREDAELARLAIEAAANPDLLTDDLVRWLASSEAQRAFEFLYRVGINDVLHRLWPKMEPSATGEDNKGRAFRFYAMGVTNNDPIFVANRTRDLSQEGRLSPESLVSLASCLAADEATTGEIAVHIRDGRLNIAETLNELVYNRWGETATAVQSIRLLEAAVGNSVSGGTVAIHFLNSWLHKGRPLSSELAELAWNCLEVAEPEGQNAPFQFDRLAAHLAPGDPDRAFALFESICGASGNISSGETPWHPMDPHRGGGGRDSFWHTLRNVDRERFVRTVLALARGDKLLRWYARKGDNDQAIQQATDADILKDYAAQGEAQAEIVADLLAPEAPGFWPMVFFIIERYPTEKAIQRVLERRIRQMDRNLSLGSSSVAVGALTEVVEVTFDPSTPPPVARWLRGIADSLGSEHESQLKAFRERRDGIDLEREEWEDRIASRDAISDVDWVRNALTDASTSTAKPDVPFAYGDRRPDQGGFGT